MSDRLHFYRLDKSKQLEGKYNDFFASADCFEPQSDYEYHFCLGIEPTICSILEDKCEQIRENLWLISKANLKEMTLAYYKLFQLYVISQNIYVIGGYRELDKLLITKPLELFDRCLHFKTETKQDKFDDEWARENGKYMLHSMFLNYCAKHGKYEEIEAFEKSLDEPRFSNGNLEIELLFNFVYLYKTYSEDKPLVVSIW